MPEGWHARCFICIAQHNTINKEAVMTDYTDELLDVMYDDHDDDVDDAVEM